jgi:hypothetical protein
MARPQRKNAEYFSHDANLRNDPRIRALRTRFGLTGYAVYCMLLEILTGADGFSVQWDEFSQEIYAGDVGVSAAEMQDIVNFCCKLQILALNAEMLSCAKLTDSLRPLLEKRENLRQKHREKTTLGDVSEAETRISEAETRISEAETHVSEAEIPQSKVKHSKVKESKVKEKESKLHLPLEKRENPRQKHREKTTSTHVSEAETHVSEAEIPQSKAKEREKESEFHSRLSEYALKKFLDSLSKPQKHREKTTLGDVSEAETHISGAETHISAAETRVSEAEIPQSKVKHSKVKESKVKESRGEESRGEEREHTRADTTAQSSQRTPETELAALQATCVMSGVPPDFTERLWNHYEATKRLDGFWIDSNGHIISNPAKKIVALWQTERAKNGNSNSNAANGMRPYPGKYDQYDNPSPSKSVYYDKYGGL